MSINTKKQTISDLFSGGNRYYIDFYQRDYQWKTDDMGKLLDDLFYRFNLEYEPDRNPTEKTVSAYDWYYLNAFVTNEYGGRTFIVDGQQRLTSLTLILIALYHMAKKERPSQAEFVKLLVMGPGLDGPTYWMGQGDRKDLLEDLFENQQQTIELESDDISFKNMYENYKTANGKLNQTLQNGHKLEAFIRYFLKRVMLVRIDIDDTEDVPMVFEVINDRGVPLKPHEVLKGKLLGQIDKEEIDFYHDIWQTHIHRLQRIDESEIDTFFRSYFRSRYVDSRAEYREFDGEYHKTIYEPKWDMEDKKIRLKANPSRVKDFVDQDLDYYASLFVKIIEASKDDSASLSPHLYFNSLNEQDRQFLLILSACEIEDPSELQKIRVISQYFDQHFTLLQLTGAYDSNRFTESIVTLNKALRNRPVEEISNIYQAQIIKDMSSGLGVEVPDPFDFRYYKDASRRNMGNRFLRYFFARIDHFIAENLPSRTAESYFDLVRKRGHVWGYDIEHILANNEENLELYASDEEFFHSERNRLGALVLLQGRDNRASRNEAYLEKRKIYSRTLIWNQTLHPDFYHKNKDFVEFQRKYGLDFHPIDVYDIDAIDHRQKLLHKMIKLIWQPVAV